MAIRIGMSMDFRKLPYWRGCHRLVSASTPPSGHLEDPTTESMHEHMEPCADKAVSEAYSIAA